MEELLNVGNSTTASPVPDMSDEEIQSYYKAMLEKAQQEQKESGSGVGDKPYSTVKPTPGMCVKARQVGKNEGKVFINVCTSSTVPVPKTITEMELLEILNKYSEDSDETVDYRVPMSIGQCHTEVDNRGTACSVYDIIVNPNFLVTMTNSQLFLGFFMSIVIEGLHHKYEVQIDKGWSVLKNKKFFGRNDEQFLRKKALIEEFDTTPQGGATGQRDVIKQPRYVLAREPPAAAVTEPEVHPEYLVAEVDLPGVKSAANLLVDVGEDRLVVITRPKQYKLDIYLPFDLLPHACGCQFDVSNKLLTVTMAVKPKVVVG